MDQHPSVPRQITEWQRDGHWLEAELVDPSERFSPDNGLDLVIGCPHEADPLALCRRQDLAERRVDANYSSPCCVQNSASFFTVSFEASGRTKVTGQMPLEWREEKDEEEPDRFVIKIRLVGGTNGSSQ